MLILRHGRNLSGPQFDSFTNSLASYLLFIAGIPSYTNTFKVADRATNDTYSLGIKWVGEGFTEMYDLKVTAGRNFDETTTADIKSAILINETAAKVLGWRKALETNCHFYLMGPINRKRSK